MKLPDEIYRKIYSYVLDLSEITAIRRKYAVEYWNSDKYVYCFEKRYLIHDVYYWQHCCVCFPSIVSAYLFDKGYYEVEDFEYDTGEEDDPDFDY